VAQGIVIGWARARQAPMASVSEPQDRLGGGARLEPAAHPFMFPSPWGRVLLTAGSRVGWVAGSLGLLVDKDLSLRDRLWLTALVNKEVSGLSLPEALRAWMVASAGGTIRDLAAT
jgi:hypothetical protein